MVRGPIFALVARCSFCAHIDFVRSKDVYDLRSIAFTNVTTHELDVNPACLADHSASLVHHEGSVWMSCSHLVPLAGY